MALTWGAKAPGSTYTYSWAPPLADGDSLESFLAVVADGDAVIETSSIEDCAVAVMVSGGTAGTVTAFTLTATSSLEEVFEETVYLPIIASTASGATCEDIITFALRKIYGLGETPDADGAAHALECLSDMLLEWRESGADVGASFPLLTSTVIYCPDNYLSAIKNNLIVAAADVFEREVSPDTRMRALRGLQHIKQKNLPEERTGAVYY